MPATVEQIKSYLTNHRTVIANSATSPEGRVVRQQFVKAGVLSAALIVQWKLNQYLNESGSMMRIAMTPIPENKFTSLLRPQDPRYRN